MYETPDGTLKLSSRTKKSPSIFLIRSIPDIFDHALCFGEKPSHSFKYKGELKINSLGITLSLNIFFAL